MRPLRVVIAGGGTGGQLFPGLAVAEALREDTGASVHPPAPAPAALAFSPGPAEVCFVGTARGIEARVLPREGFPLELIDVGGLKGGGVFGLLRGLLRVPRALAQSFAILRRMRPDLVVGVGGYASGPMVLAAALARIPTAILEQNSVPGITNRILGRVVTAIYAAFPGSVRFFPAHKVELLGNPIRARLREALASQSPGPAADDAALQQGGIARTVTADAALQQAGAADAIAWKTLLVLGGSQGAHPVNELVAAAVPLLRNGPTPIRIVHQTGRSDRDAVAAGYLAAGAFAEAHEFIDDMGEAYRSADLVVARAGATTIAELTALGRASILIPFPEAADDHQTMNARALEAAAAALVFPQRGATPAALAEAIGSLIADDARRARMAAAARALGRPDAAATIAAALRRLAGR